MLDPSDHELWRRIRADDAEAFGLLFGRHGPAIERYVLRRTADPFESEDVAATVFMEAWIQRHRVELYQPSALPWLYGIATNVLRNARRRSIRDQATKTRLLSLPPVRAELVERRVEAAEEARTLLRYVATLPRRQQDVLILSSWEGLSIGEIAVALDLPPGTVKSRLSRARARLAHDMAPAPPRAAPPLIPNRSTPEELHR